MLSLSLFMLKINQVSENFGKIKGCSHTEFLQERGGRTSTENTVEKLWKH